ncbi:hypothetical protein G7Y89_g2921 [Cudoniella acicularis]|uniref:Uncharacterized protein n=1 Tax=Cudoniella acicularis TaxID=354080 RepID=A0A8H4RT70_9HELO|nr:hypothetical protein G7Y89_g2921 [Cudoniella acicularis]
MVSRELIRGKGNGIDSKLPFIQYFVLIFATQTFQLKDPPQPSSDDVADRFVTLDDPPDGYKGPNGTVTSDSISNAVPDPAYWQLALSQTLNMADYAPITVNPSPPTNPVASLPQCGANGYTASYTVVMSIQATLAMLGGQQCCTDDIGGCKNIASDGPVSVDLCSDPNLTLCVNCGRLADYVADVANSCHTGQAPNMMVGGTQDIVETPGLKIEI